MEASARCHTWAQRASAWHAGRAAHQAQGARAACSPVAGAAGAASVASTAHFEAAAPRRAAGPRGPAQHAGWAADSAQGAGAACSRVAGAARGRAPRRTAAWAAAPLRAALAALPRASSAGRIARAPVYVGARVAAQPQAVRQAHVPAMRLLLQGQPPAEPNARCLCLERGCEFPLQLAVCGSNFVRGPGRAQAVELLLQAGARPSPRRSDAEGIAEGGVGCNLCAAAAARAAAAASSPAAAAAPGGALGACGGARVGAFGAPPASARRGAGLAGQVAAAAAAGQASYFSAAVLLTPITGRAAGGAVDAGAVELADAAWGVPEVYTAAFLTCLSLALLLALRVKPWDDGKEVRGGVDPAAAVAEEGLRTAFLPVWLLCVAGDWLQGPYVYALYEAYGLPREDIARLFVAGFGASFAFGTGDGEDGLPRTFGLMWFGSSVVAILAGPAGDLAVSVMPLTAVSAGSALHYGGLTAAFDLAIACLLLGLGLLTATWGENFGAGPGLGAPGGMKQTGGGSPLGAVAPAWRAVAASPALLALGVAIAGFEASVFTFVFNWTSRPPALGRVFATFMLAYMSGSLAFQLFGPAPPAPREEGQVDQGEETAGAVTAAAALPLRAALLLAPLALLPPALALNLLPAGSTEYVSCVLGGFVAFEFCAGLYSPAVSAVKGALVPEAMRSSIRAYRAPMNAAVVAVLLGDMTPARAGG
ncbi:unnamed protein product [Prorocentrum cordatum]|uniref:Uncharacterized protein n=1 Tax=Prorocentrum cordatum TaxID=2364126 RepID=A0ABN9QR09_9DINO|nr:unnamed protein product [Polarella glacialis]